MLNTQNNYVYYSWIKVCAKEHSFIADKCIPLLHIITEIVPEMPEDRYIVALYGYGEIASISIYSAQFFSPLSIEDIGTMCVTVSYDRIAMKITEHSSHGSVLSEYRVSLDDPLSLSDAKDRIFKWCSPHLHEKSNIFHP